MGDRPLMITILGGLTALAAVIVLLIGAVFLMAPSSLENMDLAYWTLTGAGIAMAIIGLAMLVTGIALLSGWTIAWYLGIIVYGISALLSIISIPASIGSSVITLVFSMVVLYYLFRPRVKEFFKV